MIPFVSDFWTLLVPVVILGVGWGISTPSMATLLASLAPKEYRAAFISVQEMSVRVGQTLGPALMVLIFGLWGIGSVFLAGAILSIFLVTIAYAAIK